MLPPHPGASDEDEYTYSKLKEIYRHIQRFDGNPKNTIESTYTDYYYGKKLVNLLYGKNPERMKNENMLKLVDEIKKKYGQDVLKRYSEASTFSGNDLFVMSHVLKLIGKIDEEEEII